MPTATYTPIASTTLSSTQTSVTFSNLNTLAAGMRDLILVFQTKSNDSGASLQLRFNGDSGSNYSWVTMNGNGSTTESLVATTNSRIILGNASINYLSADPFFIGQATIFDFSQTNKHKSALVRSGQSNTNAEAIAGRWANTSAITSIEVSISGAGVVMTVGSTFSLYGVIA